MVRSVALIKLQYNLELSEYLELALQSTISQSQILKLQKATAQANLFIGQIGKIVILLPPLEEQKEIVRRVEKMFAKIDKMEQEYQKAAKLCDRLEQATLAKAFRGELVPQDPDDEPASVLLEQVKSQKVKGKIKTKK
jgi:type I restriction enzyme S subunit